MYIFDWGLPTLMQFPLMRIPLLQLFITLCVAEFALVEYTMQLMFKDFDLACLKQFQYVIFCFLWGFPKSQKPALWGDPANVRCNNYGPDCSFYVQLSQSQYLHEFIVIARLNTTWFQHVLNAYLEFLV